MPARAACLKAAGGQGTADARLIDNTVWKRKDDSFCAAHNSPRCFNEHLENEQKHVGPERAKHKPASHAMTYWLIAAQSPSITMVIANRRMQFPTKWFDLPFRGGILGEPYGKAEILIFKWI